MAQRWIAGSLAVVLIAAGCSARPPTVDAYTVVSVDSIETERWSTSGDCNFDYRSQLMEISLGTGEVVWQIDVPHSHGELFVDGDFAVVAGSVVLVRRGWGLGALGGVAHPVLRDAQAAHRASVRSYTNSRFEMTQES